MPGEELENKDMCVYDFRRQFDINLIEISPKWEKCVCGGGGGI